MTFQIQVQDSGQWVSPASLTGEGSDSYECTTREDAEKLLAHLVEQYEYADDDIRIVES